jgi:ferredoxin
MNIECYSIEEKIDFGKLISSKDVIVFSYPIYGSRVPRIMREFIEKYLDYFKNKKIVIFCTQWLFSGDGARVFSDMFPLNFINVIYAEHFLMPNNVNNLFFLPLANDKKIKRYMEKAEEKMQSITKNIVNGIVKKRGFNIFSRLLGLMQGIFMPNIERKSLNKVWIDNDCNQCSLCISTCPMNNLEYKNDKVIQKNNCAICYRCINKCPKMAIALFFHGKVKRQYKGILQK